LSLIYKMNKRVIFILLILLAISLGALFILPNVIKMYACVEGGGNWSWTELECTPYQDKEQ